MREAFDVYQRFLLEAQQLGLLRPDVHQHLMVQRLVDAAQKGQWTGQELWDAITSALAQSEQQLKDLQQLVQSNHKLTLPPASSSGADSLQTQHDLSSQAAVPQAALPAAQLPVIAQGRGRLEALKAAARWVAPKRWRWLLATALGAGLLVAAWLLLHKPPSALPPPPPVLEVVEKPRPDSRYVKRALPLPKDAASPKLQWMPLKLWQPSVGQSALGGLFMVCLSFLGLLLLRAWPQLRKQLQTQQAQQQAAKQEAQHQEQQRQAEAAAKHKQLELEAAQIGLSLRPDFRLKLQPPLPLTLLDDTATLLGRIYQAARGHKLDVKATLKRTFHAGGKPTPVFLPRRRAVPLLVLYDEWDTRPYLPSFLKLLDRWQKLGVCIERFVFQKNPQELQSDTKQHVTQLEDLLHLHPDSPVILFASHLHIRGQDAYQNWDQQLHQTDLKVWLDPDPRPFAQRDGVEQEAILQLAPQLPRFGLTVQGVTALVRYLAQQGKGVQIPAWEPLHLAPHVEESLQKWLACGVTVPDCSYPQFEAVRQTFLAEELPDPRSVRLLIQWFQSEFGTSYRVYEDTVVLGEVRKLALKRWLRKQHPALTQAWNQRLAADLVQDPCEDPQQPPNLAQLEQRKRYVMYLAGAQATPQAALQQLDALDDFDHLVDQEALRREVCHDFDFTPKAQAEEALPLKPPPLNKARLLGTTTVWTAATFALLVGLYTWTWRTRADWIGRKLPQPVLVKVEHIQDYKIEKAQGFPEVAYRPALLPIPLSDKPFLMGSPKTEKGRYPDEEQHEVTLTYPFLMMETEVTQGQYEALMGENPSRSRHDALGVDCNRFGVGPNFPVYCVDWFDAVAYANRLSDKEGLAKCYEGTNPNVTWPQKQGCKGYRLPTEAEWEYAARAGSTLPYAGSDMLEAVAWHGENATRQVKGKLPNAWGLHDMTGNEWEWVWDQHDQYKAEASKDPIGPLLGGSHRVGRGGFWGLDETNVRVALRFKDAPRDRRWYLGFRLVRSYP